MWRAFFLAVGISLCILGIECIVLDSVVMAADGSAAGASEYDAYGFEIDSQASMTAESRKIDPPEWVPWSLLSSGAIVLLYALTKQAAGG